MRSPWRNRRRAPAPAADRAVVCIGNDFQIEDEEEALFTPEPILPPIAAQSNMSLCELLAFLSDLVDTAAD
jgi:hypothetical protein